MSDEDKVKKHFQNANNGFTHPDDNKPLDENHPYNIVVRRSDPKNGAYQTYEFTFSYDDFDENGQVHRVADIYTRQGDQFIKNDYTSFSIEEGFNELAKCANYSPTGTAVLYTDDGKNPPDRAAFDMSNIGQKREFFTRIGTLTKPELKHLKEMGEMDTIVSEFDCDQTNRNQNNALRNLSQYGNQLKPPKM